MDPGDLLSLRLHSGRKLLNGRVRGRVQREAQAALSRLLLVLLDELLGLLRVVRREARVLLVARGLRRVRLIPGLAHLVVRKLVQRVAIRGVRDREARVLVVELGLW